MSAAAISRSVPKCVPPFYSLHEVPSLHGTIKPYLDPTIFDKCLKMKDRQCEVLTSSDMKKALGLIVYKLDLHKKDTLIVRSFKVIDPKVNIEKGYQVSLLKRVHAIASEWSASKVVIDLSKESPLTTFIKERGFEVKHQGDGAYEKKFTHYEAKIAAIRLSAIAKHLKPEEGSRKRKRGSDEESASGRRRVELERPLAPPPPPSYPPHMAGSYEPRGSVLDKPPSMHSDFGARAAPPRQPYGGRMNGRSADYGTSLNSAGVKVHKMPMKGTVYLQAIMDGVKKFEGRVNGPMYKRFRIGDEIRLFDGRAGWGIRCRINALDAFSSFRDMLIAKGVVAMLPQMKDKAAYLSSAKLIDEGERVYKSFPGSHRVAREGCVAIGVQFLEKIYER